MNLINLLDYIKENETVMYETILVFLNKRLKYLYDNEPDGDIESTYEKWEDKIEDLQNIINNVELLIKNDPSVSYDKIKIDIKVYQKMYGGLKKIK